MTLLTIFLLALLNGVFAMSEMAVVASRRRNCSGEEESVYETLAGFVLQQLGRVPQIGDHFEWNDLRFEIVDMDGNRIDRVLVNSRPQQPETPGSQPS